MLRPSEPVTYVRWDGILCRWVTALDRTVTVATSWFTVEGLTPALGMGAEGVVWIRGHHDEQSPEVQALLAAHALERSHAA